MKTLIDVFRQFHKMSEDGRFSAQVRSVGFAIIAYWNEYGRRTEFDVYHDRLKNASGVNDDEYRLALDSLSKRHIIKRTRTRRRGCARFTVEIAQDGVKTASTAGDYRGEPVSSVSTSPQEKNQSASASDARKPDDKESPVPVENLEDKPIERRLYEASNVLVSYQPGTEKYEATLAKYSINYEQLFEYLTEKYPESLITEELTNYLIK